MTTHTPRKRPFPRNPFCRDWILSYVLIGIGFMMSSSVTPLGGIPGLVIGALGVLILLTAIGHAARRLFKR